MKEFQRLKELNEINGKWDIRRYLSKANYKIQTDAVKRVLIPLKNPPKDKEGYVYAEEADLLYLVMYGYTSKQWRDKNPDLHLKGFNIRDVASTHELIVLTNLESINASLIDQGVTDYNKRFAILRRNAISQLKSIQASKEEEYQLIESPNKEHLSDFNKKLITAIENKPKK